MADLTLMGSKTPMAAIHKNESHKLSQSFPVKTEEKALPGQLIVLNTDGTVQGFKTGDSLDRVIGVCINSSQTPAYQSSKQYGNVEVTVAVSGHAIINAVAASTVTAGPVKPTGALDTTGKYAKYAAITDGDPVLAVSLNEADANEVIQVLVL